MSQTGHQNGGWDSKLAGMGPQELAEMGKGFVDSVMQAQAGFLHELQQANEEWIANMQLKLNLASTLCTKLMSAHSMPEVATACQDWATQRANLFAEDGRCALAHGQKILESGTRLMSSGSLGGSAQV
jgi:hypothetical protein